MDDLLNLDRRSLLASGLVAFGSLAYAAPLRASVGQGILADRIDRAARQAIEAGESVGLQIAVHKGGRSIISRGYGFANVEQGTKATPATIFRVASVTKEVTAAAILHFVERGALSLDSKVSKFFPEFDRGNDVSIKHLLGHTSGIRNFDLDACGQDASTDARLKVIMALPDLYEFAPGTAWSYSNSGYFILGAIVEKLSGRSYNQFLSERLFRGLAMTNTALDSDESIVPHRASGYEAPAGPRVAGGLTNAQYTQIAIAGGAGALRSTANDLAAWQGALMAGKIISLQSLDTMGQPIRLDDGRLASSISGSPLAQMKQAGFEIGFGMVSEHPGGHRKIGHTGGFPGFAASAFAYPDDDLVIIILSNMTGGPAMAGVGKIAPAIESIALGLTETG